MEEKGVKLHSTGGIPGGREGEKGIGGRGYGLSQGLEAWECVVSLGRVSLWCLWSDVTGAWCVEAPDGCKGISAACPM